MGVPVFEFRQIVRRFLGKTSMKHNIYWCSKLQPVDFEPFCLTQKRAMITNVQETVFSKTSPLERRLKKEMSHCKKVGILFYQTPTKDSRKLDK